MDLPQQTNKTPAGIYAETSTEVTAAGAGLASPTGGGDKSPVTNKNEQQQQDKTTKTTTTTITTQEEEDLLLTPSDDDACSVASSAFSGLSTTSVRSRISNCKKTVKRLGSRNWKELNDIERRRLQNARAFLANDPKRTGRVLSQPSKEVNSTEGTSVNTLMGPPNPPTGKIQSKESPISLETPSTNTPTTTLLKQTAGPLLPTRPGMEPLAPSGLEGGKVQPLEMDMVGPCGSGARGTSPIGNSGTSLPSLSSGSSVIDLTTNTTMNTTKNTVIEKKASRSAGNLTQRVLKKKRRNAERIVRRLSSKNPETLTAREKLALGNATQKLKTLTTTDITNNSTKTKTKTLRAGKETVGTTPHPEPNSTASKRTRQDDKSSPTNPSPKTKRRKTLITEGTTEKRQFAIADFGTPSRKLSDDQWQLMEVRILDEVNDVIVKNGQPPLFGNLRTVHGFKMLTCEDDYTLVWLQDFVKRTIAPWPNANLRLMGLKEIKDLNRPKAKMMMRGPTIPRDRIERYLQSLNTEQLSENWKVLEMGEQTKDGTEVVVQLSHKSIPLLRKIGFKVRIGINRCKLRLIANKNKQVSKGREVFNKL